MPLLFVSLAVNLLIAGMVAGAFLSPDGPRRGGIGGDERALRGVIGEPFFRALPDGERKALVRDAIQNGERVRESRETLRQRLDAFLDALRADPFDSAEVARLLGEQRDAALSRQELGEELLLKRLDSMSAEQRAAYADALEERLKRFRR
jgi:uncharacterized membrane protein